MRILSIVILTVSFLAQGCSLLFPSIREIDPAYLKGLTAAEAKTLGAIQEKIIKAKNDQKSAEHNLAVTNQRIRVNEKLTQNLSIRKEYLKEKEILSQLTESKDLGAIRKEISELEVLLRKEIARTEFLFSKRNEKRAFVDLKKTELAWHVAVLKYEQSKLGHRKQAATGMKAENSAYIKVENYRNNVNSKKQSYDSALVFHKNTADALATALRKLEAAGVKEEK